MELNQIYHKWSKTKLIKEDYFCFTHMLNLALEIKYLMLHVSIIAIGLHRVTVAYTSAVVHVAGAGKPQLRIGKYDVSEDD